MILIIDGYNFLKTVQPRTITERERNNCIQQMQKYAQRKDHIIWLIFDGGPYDAPVKDIFESVTVIYTGRKKSADDYMIDLVSKNQGAFVAVTSDKKLTSALQHYIPVVRVEVFNRYFCAALDAQENKPEIDTPLQKLSSDKKNSWLDALMQQASRMIYHKKEDQDYNEREQSEQKRSKTERKLDTILKKL